jgi:hypothetical protein
MRVRAAMNSRKRHNERVTKQSEESNVHPLTDQLVSSVARQDARAFPSDSVYLGKLCAFGNSDRPQLS